MQSRVLRGTDHDRTFVLAFDAGEEAMSGLAAFVEEHAIAAASLTGIGAFERVTLGYFQIDRRDYKRIEMNEQVEVLTLSGNVARIGEKRKVHAHVIVGRADGSAHGGHLLEARVRPTLEVLLVESPAGIRRTSDPKTGLALLDL